MAISINEITSGIGLSVNNEIYLVTDYSHVKPGKGSAFVRVKLKNIKTEAVLERTFKTSERLDDVFLEERDIQFLYRAGDAFHFMDQSSYEERIISEKLLGDVVKFLQDNLTVTAIVHNNEVLKVILPNFIVANVVETEPGFKGDSSRAGNKPAIIDSGATVQVPLFINKGDWVKIDTRSSQYVERVQK